MTVELSLLSAFAAGLLSFVSPCVLPLVPAYLSFLGGVGFEQMTAPDAPLASRGRVLARAAVFVAGFATVFVLLGATASAAGRFVTAWADQLSVVAGLLLIVLGLHVAGWLRIGLLMREARPHGPAQAGGFVAAYLVGLAFGFGWTPCVGPILASILLLSGASDTISQGALLLVAYAAGIGLPFLVAAAFAPEAMRWMAAAKRRMHAISVATGLILIATGAMIATGTFGVVGAWLLRTFPIFERIG
ncbi:MAG TPA: cytochrome c biogenesis protein CcdA [Beijerinckiaceae bacterium]|jgi:cytochrome c-type biogenesis protein